MQRRRTFPRRRALTAATWTVGAVVLPGCGTSGTGDRPDADPLGSDGPLVPTPACGEDAPPSLAQIEGPFYTPNTPARASLIEPGVRGTPLVLEGFVVTTACRPIAGAIVDLWQCDGEGVYDNDGFRLRGHQSTTAEGGYRFQTVKPGLYPGRTRHFHVKVGVPGSAPLTTQLYFPDEPANARDGIFHRDLVVRLEAGAARFTFVLPG